MLTAHPTALPDGRIPVLLTAQDADLVRAEAAGLLRYLESRGGQVSVPAVAQTLRRTRPVRRHRAVVSAHDTAELIDGLTAVYRGADHPRVARSDRPDAARTAFVFPGQGNQWPGMGAELLGIEAYRSAAQHCDEAFRRAGHTSPLGYLSAAGEPGADPVLVQAAQFTHATALAATWRGWGVLPDITVGHSLGELAAAYTAGVIDLDAAVAVVATRAVLTDSPPGRFGMAMLSLGVDAAADLIADVAGWLELSVVNGPESVVVSGELDAVRDAVRRVGERGVFARELAVGYPAHTSALAPLREPMLARLPDSEFHSAPVEFVGSVFGGPVPAGMAFRQYWYENLRNTVRFDLAAAAAVARGASTFIEMSAQPTLLVALADTAGAAQLLASSQRDRPALETLSGNIAAAAVADPGYRWRDFAPAAAGAALRHFPHAPMRATKLWLETGLQPTQHPGTPVTMAECWLPVTEQPRWPAGSVAVVDYTGSAAELTARLTAALGDSAAAPADAEHLVLVAPPADETDIAVAASAFAASAGAQTAVIPGPQCRRVWLLTTGAEQVAADPPPRPGAAALAALHRSVGFDYPDHTHAHLDLPRDPTVVDLAAAVTALGLADTEIAVRAGQLTVRRLRTCQPAPTADAVPATVVITGGTGAIGLAYAAYCAEHGARDITLLSRSAATAATAARLAAIRRCTGARITAIRADLTDAAAIRAAVGDHRPVPAGLVVHAASAPALAARLTAAAVRDAFGAKVLGLDNLVQRWPLRPDARILVCSSVLALWGGSGHGLYAAANRMADALVGQLRVRGLAAGSVRWGLWQTVAVVSGVEKDRIARVGLTPMPPDAAIAAGMAGMAGMAGQPADPVIFAADWQRLAVFFDSQGVPAPFQDHPGRTVPSSTAAPDRPLPEVVATELAAVLGMTEAGDIDMTRALVDLGLDSLLALDLRKRLGRATGRRVALGPLLAGITGSELAAALGSGVGKDRVHHD